MGPHSNTLETEYYSPRRLFHSFAPRIMGTKLEFIMTGPSEEESERIWAKLLSEAQALESLLSRFDGSSEVSALNSISQAGEVFPSHELLEIIADAEGYRMLTGGLFDVTLGTSKPSLFLSGRGVDLRGGSLDFGGYAKGLLCRRAKALLSGEPAVESAYLDFGGSSITTIGTHPFGDCWKVSVCDPFSGRMLKEVELRGSSLSVSGSQPHYEGHIKDPRTGRIIEGRCLVICEALDPLDAEVGSTAAVVSGGEKLEFLQKNLHLSQVSFFNL